MLPNPQVQEEPDDAQGQHLGRHEQEAQPSAQRPVSDNAEASSSSLILKVNSKEPGQDDDTIFNLSHFFEMQVQEEPGNVQDLEMLLNPQAQEEPDDAQGQHLGRHGQEAQPSAQRPVSDNTKAFNSSLILTVDSKETGQDDDTAAGHAHKLDCPYGLGDNMEYSTDSSQGTKTTLGAGGQAKRLLSEPQSIIKPTMLLLLIASISLGIMGSAVDTHPGNTQTHTNT